MHIVMYTQFSHLFTFLRAFVFVTGGTRMVWKEEIKAASLHFRPSKSRWSPLETSVTTKGNPRTWLTTKRAVSTNRMIVSVRSLCTAAIEQRAGVLFTSCLIAGQFLRLPSLLLLSSEAIQTSSSNSAV